MKIKFTSLVDDAAGKDGNLVIRRSRSGPIAVPLTVPLAAFNDAQLGAQANLGASAREFQNLTDAQIAR